jgi:hypothetical protein
MKYLMLICGAPESEPTEAMGTDTEKWVAEMDARGVRVFGDRLRPVADSTTVRVRGGEQLLTDGPFTEAMEQIGGFDLLECADLDEALAVAAAHPWAAVAAIEVRPLWPFSEGWE